MTRFAILRETPRGLFWVTPLGAAHHASEAPPASVHYSNPNLARQDVAELTAATYTVVELTPETVAEIQRRARGVDAPMPEKEEPAAD